jgi:ribosomal protein S18 acetylase RimI-like enzyme
VAASRVTTSMADTFTIRRATAADAPAIGAVFDAAVRVAWTYLGELAQNPMFEPEEWEREVADHEPPNVLLVAADAAGAVRGFVAAHPADGELFLLFVHPDAAGRGVGRRLLDAAHDALRDAGCQEAYLYTHDRNERALAVYRAAGYRPDGTVRESDFRGTAIREPRLVKPL